MKLPRIIPIAYAIMPAHETAIYGADVTRVEICDEGGGAFLIVTQHPDTGTQTIRLDPEEIPALAKVAKLLGL